MKWIVLWTLVGVLGMLIAVLRVTVDRSEAKAKAKLKREAQ